MFQANLVYFLVGIVTVAYANESDVGIKRSAVCLIARVAHHNNIEAIYTKTNIEQMNGTTHLTCKLKLGTEEYAANSTSISKAKERVSRVAYSQTKYTKPKLQNRTCIVQPTVEKNDISLLQEYADSLGMHPLYEEKPHNVQHKFGFEVRLNGKKAEASSNKKKKEAKKMAATNLIELIGRRHIVDTLTAKFNKPKYHSMEPTKRLRKVIQVSDATEDAIIYTMMEEVTETLAGKATKRISMQVEANDFMVIGTGSTTEEAKTNAAAKLLRHLNFTVDYPPTTHS